jgi:hypothetical protein
VALQKDVDNIEVDNARAWNVDSDQIIDKNRSPDVQGKTSISTDYIWIDPHALDDDIYNPLEGNDKPFMGAVTTWEWEQTEYPTPSHSPEPMEPE